jgi:hypothetical protein
VAYLWLFGTKHQLDVALMSGTAATCSGAAIACRSTIAVAMSNSSDQTNRRSHDATHASAKTTTGRVGLTGSTGESDSGQHSTEKQKAFHEWFLSKDLKTK